MASSSASVVASLLREVPDFPSPGILFRDIAPVLVSSDGLRAAIDGLIELVEDDEIDVVAAIEARGFVLGAAVALELGVGFVPVRKAGKLPGPTLRAGYDLEYGSAEIEVQADAFEGGSRVLVVDDVLATGGTAATACRLVRDSGAEVALVAVLIELEGLGGRAALGDDPVRAVLSLPA